MMCYVKLAGPERDILHASLVILQCIGREDEGERQGMGRLRWQLVERFFFFFMTEYRTCRRVWAVDHNKNNSD